MTLSSGTLLNNRYRIVSILGLGGMGAVYRALDEHLGISVALKENLILTDEYTRQFQREANILSILRQPNLPQVRDYFSVPAQGQYLVMDFIDGEDLRARINRQRILPEKEVILIGVLICDALSYLHSRKPPIVHRDIKPGNIKITPEGEAYLVDFGLAKVFAANQATSTGARAMTPGFSPPEQYGTALTDARTDIYSLGATLYAVLTGMVPEDGLARATGKEQLTPIRDLEGKVNRRLAAIVEKALELDPLDRFQTAEEFRKALVEVGEVNPASINRLTISPPTVTIESPAGEESFASRDEAAAKKASRLRSSHARRRRILLKRIGISIPIVIAIIALVVLAAQSQLPGFRAVVPSATPLKNTTGTQTAQVTASAGTTTMSTTAALPTLLPAETIQPSITPTTIPTATSIAAGIPQIAFASNRTGSTQIWLMNADGSNLIQLTANPSGACQPSWSPDGLQIAFVSPCLGKDNYAGGRIFIINVDGKNLHPLPMPNNPEGDYDPAWSPDGNKIAFTSRNGIFTQIFVFNFDTSTSINISNTKTLDSTPAWSPDSKFIAFSRQTVNIMIWLMSDKGQNQAPLNLYPASINSFDPSWTPDGQLILFSQNKANSGIPWLTARRLNDQTTTGGFRIPASGQDIGPVAGANISPDGLWIVYESWPDGKNHDIFLITINGTDRTQLTNDAAFDFSPAFRLK